MRNLPWIVAVILLSAAQAVYAVSDRGIVVTHSETLENLSLNAAARQDSIAGAPAAATLVFDALGQRFDLALEPNSRLVRGRLPQGIAIYRGKLVGKPDSWVRITMKDGVPTGLIWDGAEMLAIEALADPTSSQSAASIYRLKDTYIEAGALTCGVVGEAPKETTLATAYAAITDELETVISNAAGAVDELQIGMVGDFEFTNSIGVSNVDAAILARMNNVDGIFSSQLGVQITVEVIDTFTDPNDPFTTSVPGDLLEQLADYRANSGVQNSQGLTHMFTGRDLDGTTVGIAFRDALCRSRFGAGLSEGARGAVTDSLIAAHEIGHNFGAEHDGETGSVCATVTGDFLMSPRVSGTDQFSSCSIDTMRPSINGASCINPLPQTDVAIALTNTPSSLPLGASTDLVFNVPNAGTQDANNVAATFVVPTNLTVDSVATTLGFCTSGGGRADCTIGTIPGSGSASVALSVTASSLGTDTLDASVVADGDANLGDNSQSVPIVVVLATDLRIVNAGSRSVALNGSVALSPRVENLSSVDATNPTVTISFSGGLRADSASWPNGTCSISAGSVTCQRSGLAAGSSAALSLQFTAIAAGSQSYSASVSATEADANSSDNSASGTVNVSGGGSDSGGGGSFGLLWMFIAALVGFSARLQRP